MHNPFPHSPLLHLLHPPPLLPPAYPLKSSHLYFRGLSRSALMYGLITLFGYRRREELIASKEEALAQIAEVEREILRNIEQRQRSDERAEREREHNDRDRKNYDFGERQRRSWPFNSHSVIRAARMDPSRVFGWKQSTSIPLDVYF
ncbi:hypothetical protein BC832DRAFT_545589 [Gaertneriomyces semiglobifer]|nr:hypothetical protein BC832DRAFT_545589 [Gaertneriomyces semiglobifer]